MEGEKDGKPIRQKVEVIARSTQDIHSMMDRGEIERPEGMRGYSITTVGQRNG